MSIFPADSYSNAQDKWLYHDHIVVPTLEFLLKDELDGKLVLDIGCGNGRLSANFLEWGARKVIGFDKSPEMIDNCRQKSTNCEFHVADVTNFHVSREKFHVATAVFVLQYLHDKSEVQKAICRIFDNLAPDGIFVGMLPNGKSHVEGPRNSGKILGAQIEKRGDPYVDGELVTAHFYENSEVKCSVVLALHSNEFYEQCFRQAGFKKVEWISPQISDAGRKLLGDEFCRQFLYSPVDIVFRCEK